MTTARVVQWTTGLVARQAIRAIVERSDLELVGVYAFSKEKVGQDAGDLVGLGRPLGIRATDDIEALVALRPDCVVYMPLHPEIEHMARLLRAGVNIVTTAGFVTGRALGRAGAGRPRRGGTCGQREPFRKWYPPRTQRLSGGRRVGHLPRGALRARPRVRRPESVGGRAQPG